MSWIVLGEKNGKIELISKSGVDALLPKGSYLTIEEDGKKFILRVDNSRQYEPYSPTPMIVDMDLRPLHQDQKCQNIISAYRIKDLNSRSDGFIDFIKPQATARLANQKEIDLAMASGHKGPKVFVATVQASQNKLLMDENQKRITARLPISMFFHQMLICGKTGSGKTVASKYLAQYFVEELKGAVLAINVKDVDFLKMDRSSEPTNSKILEEWKTLGEDAHGVDNFMVYYPANSEISESKDVTPEITKRITLSVRYIDPEALVGLLHNISDIGSQNLPNIFRYWKNKYENKEDLFTFSKFVEYFQRGAEDKYYFKTLNTRGEESSVTLHKGTWDNILRNLDVAIEFFDNPDATNLDETDILLNGKMSVIDVTGKNGIQFGSVLLRDLLHRIVQAKSNQKSTVPILIIIDEVHMFYSTGTSYEALGDLDTICRTGRSQEIGVIFSSQNPADLPRGLSTVINTKIFFKSDRLLAKSHGVEVTSEEMESLGKGFAVASIHDLSQLKILKFPLSYAGVFEREGENYG